MKYLLDWIEDVDDKVSDNMIVPITHANYLWTTSWLSLLSAMYAIKQGHCNMAVVPFSVYCTSLLYWHKPTHSWRRIIDILVCNASLYYQLYIAKDASYKIPYYYTTALAVCCYPLSTYFQHKNNSNSQHLHIV